MYKHLLKDFLLRKLFYKHEKEQLVYKCLSSNIYLPFKTRSFFRRKFFKLGKKLSKSKIKNYCLFTGRGRGVLRTFRMSRAMAKKNLSSGLFSGFRRAS